MLSGKEKNVLEEISKSYQLILHDKLVGIYVHGSIAFGCFNWDNSDIDFLVITNSIPTQSEKVSMIQKILDLQPICPKKGLEMSIVLEKYCKNFVYPTPYELHFSNTHLSSISKGINEYCDKMHGFDKDLAAHFTATKAVGFAIFGKSVNDVFTSEIPKSDFLDSVVIDIENSNDEIERVIEDKNSESFVYIILNLCRVLAFIKDDVVISKEQGGNWGMKNLEAKFLPVIQAAMNCYKFDKIEWPQSDLIKEFVQFMIKQIIH